ncbi:MAG: hypothetical protein AAFV78_10345, partial [Bacteroidota bacterium]
YISFGDEGIIDELGKSTKYVPPYALVERLKAQAQELSQLKVRQEKVRFAKLMKEANEPLEKIIQFTGLSREEIEQIEMDK